MELNDDGTWRRILTAEKPSGTFRRVAWGATKGEVRAAESTEPIYESPDSLQFEVRLGQYNCLAVYVFVNSIFVRGKYVLKDTFQNENRYLHVYTELCEMLSKKYGPSIDNNTYWLNDTYRDDPQDWGRAVEVGDLRKFTGWETADSTVLAALMGENFSTDVSIEYSSRRHDGLESAVREGEILEDL